MPKIFNDFRQDSINIDNIDLNLLNGKIFKLLLHKIT
jgi:hypothetical protein